MAGKTYRINKVATELNVSYQTLIEKLNENGYEVEVKPSAKITGEMYDYLLVEYKSDKVAKDKSKNLDLTIQKDKVIKKTVRKEEVVKKPAEEKEPEEKIIVKNTLIDKQEEKASEVEKVDEVKVEKEPVVEKKEDKKVVSEESPKTDSPKEETKQPEKEVVEETKEDGIGPKVIGKIDLDKISPTKPVKKKATKKTKEEKPKDEPKQEKVEAPVEEADEVELIETKFEKLKGLSVKGKIELKEEVAPVKKSHSKEERKKKRTRKVVEKVKIDEAIKGRNSGANSKNKGKSSKSPVITEKEIQDKLKATLSKIDKSGRGRSHKSKNRRQRREDGFKRRRDEEQMLEESKVIQVTEFLSANDLANLMDVNVTEIITACFSLGLMVSINQRLDAETITIVADEFGHEVEFVDAEAQIIEEDEEEDREEDLEPRAPIVTVMGHVDHGKTSLLDYIRSANVTKGEAGGITQHIGAYDVVVNNDQKITFLDTPGHEAFTAMRARGAKLTDIAVIVIAADDSIMPQTKEAISHAQAAGVPMIFAINKIDKPTANPDKIREELSQLNILVEEWGGKYQCQEIAAKFGTNVDLLLDKILLEAELMELKANPNKRAQGTVIEAKMDKGRGVVTNLLVQAGTLEIGDHLVAGAYYGKVKAIFNAKFNRVDEATPSQPVSILGFSGIPTAGDPFQVFADETTAKELANKRFQLLREQGIRSTKHITLDEIGRRLAVGNFKELNLIVKGDVDGSVEALSDSLLQLSTEEIQVNVIHKGVGQITESDVLLASASDAIIIGFQVRPAATAKKLAETEQIDIRHYSVIYKAIEEIKSAMEGLLSPEIVEKVIGEVEIRETFKISKVGTIAGCMVLDGKITRNSQVRVIRDGVVIHTGKILSLKRFKDDVKEVVKGFECGLQIDKFNDLIVGDNVEVFIEEEVKRKLK